MTLLTGKFIADIFVQEVPSGDVDGINTAYTLANSPQSNSVVLVFVDGIIQRQGLDYTVNSTAITMTAPPVIGQDLYCFYVKR